MDNYKERRRERRIRDRMRMTARGRHQWLETYYHVRYSWVGPKFRLHQAEMHGRRFHNNLCLCSCDMCGNPRHSGYSSGKYKLTMQERRALVDEKNQLEELRKDGGILSDY